MRIINRTGRFCLVGIVMAIMACGHAHFAPTVRAEETPSPSSSQAPPDKAFRPPRADTAAWTQALDNILTPIVQPQFDKNDERLTIQAVSAAYAQDFAAAEKAQEKLSRKLAHKIVRWYFMRFDDSSETAAEVETFRLANQDWPSQKRLSHTVERKLFFAARNIPQIKSHFANRKPQTAAGYAALSQLYLAHGQMAKAENFLSKAWAQFALDQKLEDKIKARLQHVLRPRDHAARAAFLLLQGGSTNIAAAARAVEDAGQSTKTSLELQLLFLQNDLRADEAYYDVPTHIHHMPGVVLNRLRWLRRLGRFEEALALAKNFSNEQAFLKDPQIWWRERAKLSRIALILGHPEQAYSIAKNHGPISGTNYHDAEFWAGFISLVHFEERAKAKKHFLAVRTSALEEQIIARALYWLGKTATFSFHPDEAEAAFLDAAEYGTTFYGQVAREGLGGRLGYSSFPSPPFPNENDIKSFLARDAVKAMVAVEQSGLTNLTSLFALHLADQIKSEGELVLLAELTKRLNRPDLTLRTAQIAMRRGFAFYTYAYPTNKLPDFRKLSSAVDKALLYAIIRQTSGFHITATGKNGTLGLMHLPPKQVRKIAEKFHLPFSDKFLLSSPALNLQLGSAYFSDLMARYAGSYVLALAAFSAGPDRIDAWLQRIGDPRSANVDPINWIETIPIPKTRNFVQNVLADTQVYRHMLKISENRTSLVTDLYAARPPDAPRLKLGLTHVQ